MLIAGLMAVAATMAGAMAFGLVFWGGLFLLLRRWRVRLSENVFFGLVGATNVAVVLWALFSGS